MRYAEHADQTPDQKAEEIAQERGARALDSKFNKFKGRACELESNLFRLQNQRRLTTTLERLNAGRWYLNLKARGER